MLNDPATRTKKGGGTGQMEGDPIGISRSEIGGKK
jgi:hypothetical protein